MTEEKKETQETEKIEEKKEEVQELSKDDLLGKKSDDAELDPSKDYCDNCYSEGVKTELSKNAQTCPKCGTSLTWS